MNKLALTIAAVFMGTSAVQAQSVKTVKKELNDEKRTVLEMTIDHEPDDVDDAWEDYLDDKYDVDLSGDGLFGKKWQSAKGVTVNTISPQRIDLYTRVVEDDDKATIWLTSSLGYDQYADNDQQFGNMRALLEDFRRSYLREYYEEKREDLADRVEDLQDDRQDLRKDRDKYKSDIAKNEEKIKKLQEENREMQQDLEETDKSLDKVEKNLSTADGQLKQVESEMGNY